MEGYNSDLNLLESNISFLNQKIIKLARNSPYDLHVKDSQIQHVYHLNLDGEFSKERFKRLLVVIKYAIR